MGSPQCSPVYSASAGAMNKLQLGEFATISGRFYGMDRDRRWDRVQASYDAMVLGVGKKSPSAMAAVESSYENRITDEFVEPVVIVDEQGDPGELYRMGTA